MNNIDFEGPWSEEEKRMVREAVRRIEANLGLRDKPWTCICEGDRSHFSVDRFGFQDVAEARSLVRLIHQLEVLASTPEPKNADKAFVALPEYLFRSVLGAPVSIRAARQSQPSQ